MKPVKRSRAARGFTLVECLVACTLVALLVGLSVPSLRGHDQRAGRLDAVQTLTRLQQAQERFRSHHGLYSGDVAALLGSPRSTQGRYTISVALVGPDGYEATANALGPQAADSACATLTLSVRQGFAQTGPQGSCWLR